MSEPQGSDIAKPDGYWGSGNYQSSVMWDATINLDHITSIGVIGDSLTYEGGNGGAWIAAALTSLGWGASHVRVDGLTGRGINVPGTTPTPAPYTTDVINNWRTNGFDPRVWLIALGTNNRNEETEAGGTFWKTQIQAVVSAIMSGQANDYIIYWIGTGYEDSNTEYNCQDFQTVLTTFASPSFVPCDYNAYLAPFRTNANWDSWWYGTDGIHNTNPGYQSLRIPFYQQCVASEAP